MAASGTIIVYSDDHEEITPSAYVHTPHVASCLLDDGVYDDVTGLDEALQQAIEVCLRLGVSVEAHFRPIHVHSSDGHVHDDWSLSDLALYLLLLNGKPRSAQRAFAQAWLLRRAFEAAY